jgi:hypothetical protein
MAFGFASATFGSQIPGRFESNRVVKAHRSLSSSKYRVFVNSFRCQEFFFDRDRHRATFSVFQRRAGCCRIRSTISGCSGNSNSGRYFPAAIALR